MADLYQLETHLAIDLESYYTTQSLVIFYFFTKTKLTRFINNNCLNKKWHMIMNLGTSIRY